MGITLLLDTHVFLWAVLEPEKLSPRSLELLEDPDNTLLVSVVSAWEISTKFRLGRLDGAKNIVRHYQQALSGLGARSLAITDAHALRAGSWPMDHKDPFDRMLAAQAHLESVPIVSVDSTLEKFGSVRLW
ncbi:MAG: type II toxin-antitoxin system VapC family toxin [Leptospirales bacterium]